MSRLVVAIILAVVLIALSGFSYYFTNNAYKSVTDNIELCEKAFLSGDNTVRACQKAKDDWEKKERILDLFTSHSITDDITESIASLYPLAETGSDEFLAECAKIKQRLNIIKRDSQINLRSIF